MDQKIFFAKGLLFALLLQNSQVFAWEDPLIADPKTDTGFKQMMSTTVDDNKGAIAI